MNYPRHRHHRRNDSPHAGRNPVAQKPANEEFSQTESSYLKSLIDSNANITVIMKTGEQFRGRIRYYDQDCFSVGLLSEKRKIFLRKENVSHIAED